MKKIVNTRVPKAFWLGGLMVALAMTASGQEGETATDIQQDETMTTERESKSMTEQESTTDQQSGQAFLNEAFQGNDAEAALAELALKKANNKEVKDLAEHIRKDHRKANERLQKIAEKQGWSLPSAGGELLNERNRLDPLTADQFDREYVNLMIKDHQKDIARFESAQQTLTGELKDFADDMLPKLREHLEHAQKAAKELGLQ